MAETPQAAKFRLEQPPARPASGRRGSSPRRNVIRKGTYEVSLPDRTPCPVAYRRFSSHYHAFDFGPPIRRKLYSGTTLDGTNEHLTVELNRMAASAFDAAQQAERERMRRKTRSGGEAPSPHRGQLLPKSADRLAGKYGACVRFRSGQMLCLGFVSDDPDAVVAQLKAGRYSADCLALGQVITIGICNRAERCWQVPRFLRERFTVTGTRQRPKQPARPRRSSGGVRKTHPKTARPPKTPPEPAAKNPAGTPADN